MNSINERQPEANHADLVGTEASAKLKVLAEKAATCFFCSSITTGKPFPARPMSVQKVDADGTLWFLCANDSHLFAQVQKDPLVQLLFQGSPHSDFLLVYGRVTTTADHAKIEELWEPILKTWFTEGKDDPRIAVLRVAPMQGYYWDTKHNRAVALAKMVVGAVSGTTLDDSIEGRLQL